MKSETAAKKKLQRNNANLLDLGSKLKNKIVPFQLVETHTKTLENHRLKLNLECMKKSKAWLIWLAKELADAFQIKLAASCCRKGNWRVKVQTYLTKSHHLCSEALIILSTKLLLPNDQKAYILLLLKSNLDHLCHPGSSLVTNSALTSLKTCIIRSFRSTIVQLHRMQSQKHHLKIRLLWCEQEARGTMSYKLTK